MRIAVCASIAVLAGCAVSNPEPADRWPSGLPPRDYFERAWESDAANRNFQTCDQYLGWVEAFYAGSPLIPGWDRRSRGFIATMSPEQARVAGPELASLGQLLASEWSKDNRQRRVTSPMLVLWSRVMQGVEDPGQRVAALDAIRSDLRAVLAGELSPDTITLPRYSRLVSRP